MAHAKRSRWCSVPGCGGPIHARGLCRPHYRAQWAGRAPALPEEAAWRLCGVLFRPWRAGQLYCCHAHQRQACRANRPRDERPAAIRARQAQRSAARGRVADRRAGQLAAVLGLDLSPWRRDGEARDGAVMVAGRWR